MGNTPRTHRVPPSMVPAIDSDEMWPRQIQEFTDAGGDASYGTSRSQVLLRAYNKYFRANPKGTFQELMDVPFTISERAAWQHALPDISIEDIAAWKRWGFDPGVASIISKNTKIRVGHFAWSAISFQNIVDMEYFDLCMSWTDASSDILHRFREASRTYGATRDIALTAQSLLIESGYTGLSLDRIMDYVGYDEVDHGKSTKIVVRVPSILTISLVRNNVPSHYLKAAWECNFRSYTDQTTLIGAYMDGKVKDGQLEAYKHLINNGRDFDVHRFIELAQSGIPFELLDAIL